MKEIQETILQHFSKGTDDYENIIHLAILQLKISRKQKSLKESKNTNQSGDSYLHIKQKQKLAYRIQKEYLWFSKNEPNNPIELKIKHVNRKFTKDRSWMAYKHLRKILNFASPKGNATWSKVFSTPVDPGRAPLSRHHRRGRNAKTHDLFWTRLAKINNGNIKSLVRRQRNRTLHTLSMAVQISSI